MNFNFFAFGLGMWEVILILVVVLILFGAKKLPELAKGLGQGIKEFKKASKEVEDDFRRAMEEEPPSRKLPPVQAEPEAPTTAKTTAPEEKKN
jgi:sec-independent protein translocase protein TatA